MTSLAINEIHEGDCLELMRDIPDKSVDLIVIDPPYNIGKDKRWDKWPTVGAYVAFMSEVFTECQRVLTSTGSFYWFHNDMEQIQPLMAVLKKTGFHFKNFITLSKKNVRKYNWKNKTKIGSGFWHSENVYKYYQTDEYLLFYSLVNVEDYQHTVDKFADYTVYMNGVKETLSLDLKFLNKKFGYVAGCNWWFSKKHPRLISENDYLKLQGLYSEFLLSYDEVKGLLRKEKPRNTFNLSDDISTVWDWGSVKGRIHPTQKPLLLIENIIRHSSNEGDMVLDCFLGSGTTAIAAINTNRNYIGIEREPEYVAIARQRIAEHNGGERP